MGAFAGKINDNCAPARSCKLQQQTNVNEVRHSIIHSSLALQPFVGLWSLFQFRNPIPSR
jgi:hypothetical protein